MNIEEALNQMPVIGANDQSQVAQQPQQPAPVIQKQPNVQIGPRYLEALEKVQELAEINSISIELPITGKKVLISPMTGTEEQRLRTGAVDPETFLTQVNKLLYNHIEYADGSSLPSFEDFLNTLYPHDKTMMIWALLAATYSTLPSMEKVCQKCKEPYEVIMHPDELMHLDSVPQIWQEDKSPEEFSLKSTILKGNLTIEVGIPSEKKRLEIASAFSADQMKNNIQESNNILSFSDNLIYFIKRIVFKDTNGDIILQNPINEIYPFMVNLPPKVKDAIRENVSLEHFDKYLANFYHESRCPHCGNTEKVDIVPEIEFFRKALSI